MKVKIPEWVKHTGKYTEPIIYRVLGYRESDRLLITKISNIYQCHIGKEQDEIFSWEPVEHPTYEKADI